MVPVCPESGFLSEGVRRRRAAEPGHGLGFWHPLIRAVQYDEMPAPVRAAWHRDAGGALPEAALPEAALPEAALPEAALPEAAGRPGRCYGRSTAPATRSTATTGVLHDGSGDGEETHRELLAWLSLRADSFGQHRPQGLRQASSIGGNYPAGLSRIRRIGNRPILERQADPRTPDCFNRKSGCWASGRPQPRHWRPEQRPQAPPNLPGLTPQHQVLG